MIIENTHNMENVVSGVQRSVQNSNDSASDLSAVTQQLASTMSEVGTSAGIINQNAAAIRTEVEEIALKSTSINSRCAQMPTRWSPEPELIWKRPAARYPGFCRS